MSHFNTKKSMTPLEIVMNIIIPAGFIVLIWNQIPLNIILKLIIMSFLGIIVFLIVFKLIKLSNILWKSHSSKKTIIITLVVFIVIPFSINIKYFINKSLYLNNPPSNNTISFKITYEIDRIGGGGSIGNDWNYQHYFNDTSFQSGDILTDKYNSTFYIKSRFSENDSIDDIGESTTKAYNFATNNNYKKTLIISQNVHVVERGGKRYAGSYADFQVTYEIIRVVPPDMTFYNIFFSNIYGNSHISCLLIFFEIASLFFIVCELFCGRKKELALKLAEIEREEEEKKRLEQEFLKNKNEFVNNLHGLTLKQIAGVPNNISFINDLPSDNTDTFFGSYTVYRSNNGSCYHYRKGCCTAYIPIHAFIAVTRYNPCSKCCNHEITIPQWYTFYKDLQEKCKKYGIEDVDS